MILLCTLSYSYSQLQTRQPMTSQSCSHIEYLSKTYNILVLILYSKMTRNVAALAVFNTLSRISATIVVARLAESSRVEPSRKPSWKSLAVGDRSTIESPEGRGSIYLCSFTYFRI